MCIQLYKQDKGYRLDAQLLGKSSVLKFLDCVDEFKNLLEW